MGATSFGRREGHGSSCNSASEGLIRFPDPFPRSLWLFPTWSSGSATSTNCIAWSRWVRLGVLPEGAFPGKTESWADSLESVMLKCLGEERDWGCEQLLMLNSLQDEARREALKQRAEQSMHQEEPGWEEDEGGTGLGALGGFVENLWSGGSSSVLQIPVGSEGAAAISAQ